MIQEINLSDIEVNRTTPVPEHVVVAMAKDIEASGLEQPLIIDRWGTLIDGLTRLRALERLGRRKVSVEVASSLEEAIKLLKALRFDPKQLSARRRRDFSESLDELLREHIKLNLRGRQKPGVEKPPQTRELVAEALGYQWFRIRRVFRWLEEDPTDPHRQEMADAIEAGHISANQLYVQLAKANVPHVPTTPPRAFTRGKLRISGGDIILPRDQRHLLEELVRQLSGAMKGAAKLAYPINIPTEEVEQYIDELARHRATLTTFIKHLRKEATSQ
jgi:hypothetical protein